MRSTGYTVRRGVAARPAAVDSYHALLELETREARDDGAIILHTGDDPPTCADCGVGRLQWAEGGYVPWHRICNRCGSHWSLHPVTYFLEPVRAAEPRDVPPSLRPVVSVRYLVTGRRGTIVHADRNEPAGRDARAPTHGALLRLVTPELVAAALAEGERCGGVPYLTACWAQRARFYR